MRAQTEKIEDERNKVEEIDAEVAARELSYNGYNLRVQVAVVDL